MPYDNPTIDDFKTYFDRDFPYSSDMSLGVRDVDIQRAFGEVNVAINQALWSDQENYSLGYLLLAAHYLVMNIRSSTQGLNGTYAWITQSKSVGSISESYSIPQYILDNALLAMYTKTNYGARYIMLLMPQLPGQTFSVVGRTHA